MSMGTGILLEQKQTYVRASNGNFIVTHTVALSTYFYPWTLAELWWSFPTSSTSQNSSGASSLHTCFRPHHTLWQTLAELKDQVPVQQKAWLIYRIHCKNLVDMVRAYYHSKLSVILQWFTVNTWVQKDWETIAAFVAELWRFFNHGAKLNNMLPDTSICGIREASLPHWYQGPQIYISESFWFMLGCRNSSEECTAIASSTTTGGPNNSGEGRDILEGACNSQELVSLQWHNPPGKSLPVTNSYLSSV